MTDTQKRIAELEALIKAQNDKITQLQASKTHTSIRVSDTGYVEVFGLPSKGRFSISLAPNGWEKLFTMQTEIMAFAKANAGLCDERSQAYRNKKLTNVG